MSNGLSASAVEVLAAAVCAEHAARLPSVQMERELYEEVNEVLVRLGGKWKRRGKAKDGVPQGVHLFPYDPAPLLAAVVETGEMPPKNPTAFFPTPPDLVAKMVEWAGLEWRDSEACRMLEPSAGTGAIADAIRASAPLAALDTVEVLPINAAMLRRKGYAPHEGDFLGWRPGYEYDAVLMNPPFSLDGDPLAYITHILHAWDLLRDGGVLVAITPTSFTHRSDAKSREFLAMVGEFGEWADVPAGAFKESGTTIATRIVYMEKDNQEWKALPYSGLPSWHVWAARLWQDSTRESCNARDSLFKKIRAGDMALDLFGAPEEPTRKAIRTHYEAVVQEANKHGEGIRPTAEDYAHLVSAFMDEYAEWSEWEEAQGKPAPASKCRAA